MRIEEGGAFLVDISAAGGEAGRTGEGAKGGIDEPHDETVCVHWMSHDLTHDGNDVLVLSRTGTCHHLTVG